MFEKWLELPGDAGKLRSAAAAHRAMSNSLQAIATTMQATDTSDLTGSTADAARRKLGEAVSAVQDHARSLGELGTTMSTQADEMDAQKQKTADAIKGLAAGIVAATVVGVGLTLLTWGFSDWVAAGIAEAAGVEAAALAASYFSWVRALAFLTVTLPNALAQAFTFQVVSEAAGGKPVLGGGWQEVKEIGANTVGIELGLITGGVVGAAYRGALPLAGLAGGVTTGAFNSTAGAAIAGNKIDGTTVLESIALAGALGAAGNAVVSRVTPAGVVPVAGIAPAADPVGGGVFVMPDGAVVGPVQPLGGGEFVQPGGALGGGAGDIELVPMPSGGSSSSSSNPGPGSENGVPGPGTSYPSTGPATGSDGPGSIASGGSAGDTPGGGSRADTSAGSTPPGSPTVSNIPDPTTPTTVEAASQPAVASRGAAGAGVPFSALAGTAGSGSSSAPASVSPLYSLSEQDLAGYATA